MTELATNKSEVISLNFEQVKKLLPQKYPFLFIDKVPELVPGERIVAMKNVSGNEYFFEGHFPKEAVMPGALIIEGMAQASIVLFKVSYAAEEDEDMIYLFGGARVRFLQKVVPGDQLRMEMEFDKVTSNAAIVAGSVYTEKGRVVEATLTFAREKGGANLAG